MKFRYYIVDNNGTVKGTNNSNLAEDLAYNEEIFIIDTEKDIWLDGDSDIAIEDIEVVNEI